MKMLLVDVKNCVVEPVDVNGLDDYYDLIGCRCIDIVNRQIGNRRFEIICDDEGLLFDNPTVSAITESGERMLVGNLLIAGLADSEGELTPLTDDDIALIEDNMVYVFDFDKNYTFYPVVLLDY